MKRRIIIWGVSILAFGVLIGGCVEGFLRARDDARRSSCQLNIIMLAADQFAKDHDGLFPPLSRMAGNLIFDVETARSYFFYGYEDYLCESDPNAPPKSEARKVRDPAEVTYWSYAYLGYFIEDERQGLAFLDAYRETIEAGGDFTDDLSVPEGSGNLGGDTLYRLRNPEALPDELRPLAERAHEIPVAVEWPGNHRQMGGQVAFLDGHTEYMLYPGDFPMTPAFIEGLRALDALKQAAPD